jgi:23S rRNA 5-hydroxycytidine C2501 synthase
LSYEFNVSNDLAQRFYENHGVKKIDLAFELTKDRKGKKIMTTKHCLKHYFGYCSKEKNRSDIREPLYLVNEKGQKFLLKFDCVKCQMSVHAE